jgi:hypothetical protein
VSYERVATALRSQYGVGRSVPVQGASAIDATAQELANAVSQALVQDGAGPGSLREAVDSGLAQAQSQLQSLGIDADDIAAVAQDVRSRLESLIAATGQGGNAAVAAAFSQKQGTAIEITTREGDVVRLSLRSRVAVAVGGVAAGGVEGTASKAAAAVVAGNRFELAVEGDLSDEELAAIQDVLAKVEALAEDFFAGDVQAAFDAAAQLEIDGGQLASVALELKLRQRLTAAGFLSQREQPAPAPASAPAAAVAAPAPATPSADVPEAPAAAGSGDPAPAPALDTRPSPPLLTASTITGYIMHLLDSLHDAGNVGYVSSSWKFKIELLYAGVTVKAQEVPQDVSGPAVRKLGEALEALR